MRSLMCVFLLCLTGTSSALEVRFNPWRAWQGLDGLTGDGDVTFDISLDVPVSTVTYGPSYQYFSSTAAQVHHLGVQRNRMPQQDSGFYWGNGLYWVQTIPQGDAQLEDVCRPAVPVNLLSRWGYRWQVNPIFNVQFGLEVTAGQLTPRRAEQCAIDGNEVDLGPLQNFLDPRLDLQVVFKL